MSSACYVYAIVGRDAPLPASDAGLAKVPCRGLAAVTGGMEAGGALPTLENVLRHEAVVEAVRREGPGLPVRFGTVFRDAEAVAGALADRYEPLAADLERLGDKVELSVTALWAAPPSGDVPPPAPGEAARGPGARYLLARAAESRRDDAMRERARALAGELDRVLGGLALDRRVSLLPTPRIAVRAAYLLDPVGVDAFRAAFEGLRRTDAEPRLLLTGPWPPYGFVRRPAEGEGGAGDRLGALVQLLNDEVRGRRG